MVTVTHSILFRTSTPKTALTALGLLSGLLLFCSALANEHDESIARWYAPEQVSLGRQVYHQYCIACHGAQAASVPRWDKQDKNGEFPPPPLNGTAHTWHHEIPLLRRTIREGGIKLGGRMPAFTDTLSAQEIDAVIAWFQSLWTDEIYANWSGDRPASDSATDMPWSLIELLKP